MVITGVIRPPPEIRAVADRTALYVAKNGRAFEARILNSEKGKTPKFSFLQMSSPFHAYYEDRIKFYETEASSGGDKAESKEEQPKPAEKSTEATEHSKKKPVREKTQKVASAIDPIAKALLDQRSKISQARAKQAKEEEEAAQQQQKQEEGTSSVPAPALRDTTFLPPPPPLELVHIVAPASLSTVQIETIQLVAQFAALDSSSARGGNANGQFLQQLTLREWNNPIFAFCQPRHSHFAYFSALVDAYRRIFSVWSAASAKAGASAEDKEADGNTKGDSVSSQTDQLVQKHSDRSKAVGLQHALEQSAYRCEYERDWQKRKSEQEEEEGEVIAIDWHDFVVVETIDFPADEVVEVSMLPPPPSSTTLTTFGDNAGAAAKASLPSSGAQGKVDAMEESDDDEQEENIRVVPSYTPKVVAASNPQASRAIDPITGKSVNVADMPEHMRIQLLDPKWAEERKKFQEKQKDSNLVSGDAIASNISRFAQARGDLFGKSEQELLNNEMDSKKRLEEANRIIREQSQQAQQLPGQMHSQPSSAAVGPSLPQAPPKRHLMDATSPEPAYKRVRQDNSSMMAAPVPPAVPPPPPPPGFEVHAPNNAAAAMKPAAAEPNPLIERQETSPVPGAQPESSPATDSQDSKTVLSEAEFAASLDKPEVTLQVRIPNDPSQMAWNFYGQSLSVTVGVMSKVKTVKEELSKSHLNGMPANKIQLKDPRIGFLKDAMSLASLNIGPTATLEMIPKTRGRRK